MSRSRLKAKKTARNLTALMPAVSRKPARRRDSSGVPGYSYSISDFAIQPKLKVGAANDTLEAEADAVADRVMRAEPADIQRKCGPCAAEEREDKIARIEGEEEEDIHRREGEQEDEEEIHRQEEEPEDETMLAKREGSGGGFEVDGDVRAAINDMRSSGGNPLPESERAFLEPRFGRDLSSVRIHTDARARSTASAINAKAYTLGNHIAFNRGEFRPGTDAGRRLLAHEITHTIQQGGGNWIYRALRDAGHELKLNQRCFTYWKGGPNGKIACGRNHQIMWRNDPGDSMTPQKPCKNGHYWYEIESPTFQPGRDNSAKRRLIYSDLYPGEVEQPFTDEECKA